MIDPVRLRDRDRWERVMEGWIDDAPDGALAHTVQLSDPDGQLELKAVAEPSPTYVIRAAAARMLAGGAAPTVLAGVARLAGVAMVAGFTRKVADATGPGDGAALVLDAAVEVARLARQVAKLPRERAERAEGDPRACWELDRAGWIDLPDSCFAYTGAGGALFATRAVTAPATADIYSPRPGQQRAFQRRKVARLERRGRRLELLHSMHDNVHGFDLRCEVDVATGRITRAESTNARLPYMGICSEPQGRVASLVGETVDADLRKRIGTLLGGPSGCAQLYDLTADLLKLLTPA